MLRSVLCSAPLLALIAAGPAAADDKPIVKDDGVNGVVVKVDGKDHTVTLRIKDADGKDFEKTFTLGDGMVVTDESGKASSLDSVQPGDMVVAVEKDGRLAQLRRARRQERREERREDRPPFDAGRFLEQYDKDKDGYIQRDELPERLRYAFDELDANKDGKLSREELEKGAALLQRQRRPSDVINVLVEMSEFDPEAREELQCIYEQLRQMDKNHDGKFDADELKAARTDIVGARVDEILKQLDTDHDGKISRDEARGALKRDFDKIDLNKDGFVDRDELMKAASQAPPHDTQAKPPSDR